MNFEEIKKLPQKRVSGEDYFDEIIKNTLFIPAKEYAEKVELLKNELGTDMNYRYILKD